MRRVRELIRRASQDFELAKMHKQIKEYVTATLLYNSAVEKVLKALFISKTRKEPPTNASIDYLARKTGVPEEISVYITSLRDEPEATPDEGFVDLEYKEASSKTSAERQAFYMDGLAKRLLDYVTAYAKL